MKGYLFTALWGVMIWLAATVFFMSAGDYILVGPEADTYIARLLLLLIVTGLLLWGVTRTYLLFDQTEYAPFKFGVIGTVIGLSLDTVSLSNHHFIFSKLDDSQVIAFTAWMSFAYALYLLVPLMMNYKRWQKSQ